VPRSAYAPTPAMTMITIATTAIAAGASALLRLNTVFVSTQFYLNSRGAVFPSEETKHLSRRRLGEGRVVPHSIFRVHHFVVARHVPVVDRIERRRESDDGPWSPLRPYFSGWNLPFVPISTMLQLIW